MMNAMGLRNLSRATPTTYGGIHEFGFDGLILMFWGSQDGSGAAELFAIDSDEWWRKFSFRKK